MNKLILALYILYLPFQLKLPQIPVFNIINLFLVLLVIIIARSRDPNQTRNEFNTALWTFLTIWTLSFIHTIVFPKGVWTMEIAANFKRLVTLALGYFAVAYAIRTKNDFEFIFNTFILSIVLVGLYTWKNGVLSGSHFGDFKRSSGPFAPDGDWTASDIVGGFLAQFTPIVFAYIFAAKKKIIKMILFLGFLGCLFGIFATYSRGSILAVAVGCFMALLVLLKNFTRRSQTSVMVIVLILLGSALTWERWVPQTVINRWDKTFEEKTEEGIILDDSSTQRMAKWQRGFDVFYANWMLGVGFEQAREEHENKRVDVHNTFISIASEMGLIGFFVFLWFLWKVFRQGNMLTKTGYIGIGAGMVGCISALVVVNIFYNNFFRDTVVGTLWIALGLLAVAVKLAGREKSKIPVQAGHHG